MNVSKIYHSREDLMAKLVPEEARVQYDDNREDTIKIYQATDLIEERLEGIEDDLEDYLNAIHGDDSDAAENMRVVRARVVAQWAFLQMAVSKFARVLRIDGNEAYQRTITALEADATVNMSGL
jgi:hypothetical protein